MASSRALARRRRGPAPAAAAALAAVLSAAAPAGADFDEVLKWVSVGGNVGASNEEDEPHWLLGAEVSAGRASFVVWGGAYLDALYDSGTERLRFSIGPELGIFCFGVDGGLLLDVGGGDVRPGFVIRPMIALKFVFPYARVGHRMGADSSSFAEFGLLLKYPFIE